jgi:HK97 family phage prohead protease
MPNRNERASRDHRQIEYRAMDARADAETGTVAGYLSTFWFVDTYGTAVHPNAFDTTVKMRGDKLPLLYQHNPDWPIGKLANLAIDSTGLKHESVVIDDGAEGTVALRRLRAGVPFAHSFGFRTLRERPATDADPLVLPDDLPGYIKANLPESVYVIEEVKLYEGSIVTFPANENAVIESVRAEVGAQALAQVLDDLRAGRLDAAGRALVAELVAAWPMAAPDAAKSAPRTSDPQARSTAEIEALTALARWGHLRGAA